MKKFQLKNTATSTTVGVYSTKAEAIKAMDSLIFKTNSENDHPIPRHGYTTAISSRYDGWAGLYDRHGQHTILLIQYD